MSQVTEDQVLEAIRSELTAIKVPGADTAVAATTWADLDVDSLDLVELVKALEDRFEVQIADGELKSIKSVGDAIGLVRSLSGAGAAA
jgi:acyl carrier protein